MVLIDFRYLFNVEYALTPKDEYPDYETYETDLFSKLLNRFVSIANEHYSSYGKCVLAIDDHTKRYWRKAFYPLYKINRLNLFSLDDEKNNISDEIEQAWLKIIPILKNTKIVPLEISGAEGDDLIAVLAKSPERHLIVSVDKDFIQLLDENIDILSPKTGEITRAEDINGSISAIMDDHILNGDASDGIPSIYAYRKPSDSFSLWFKKKFKTKLTEDVYFRLMTQTPEAELLYKSDILNEYRDNIGFYNDSETFFSTILERELSIKRIPLSYKIERNVKNSVENGFDRSKIFAKDKFLSYNYRRNQRLIDLRYVDTNIVKRVISAFETYRREYGDIKTFCSKYQIPISEIK